MATTIRCISSIVGRFSHSPNNNDNKNNTNNERSRVFCHLNFQLAHWHIVSLVTETFIADSSITLY